MNAIMERVEITRADKVEKSKEGRVSLTFDAGGQSNEVRPNPVVPRRRKDGRYEIRWKLKRVKNTNRDWAVEIANVVLCAQHDTPKGFRSERGRDGLSWTWTFDEPFESEICRYELFYTYFPNLPQPLRPPSPTGPGAESVSLRQVVPVDPTIFTQPGG